MIFHSLLLLFFLLLLSIRVSSPSFMIILPSFASSTSKLCSYNHVANENILKDLKDLQPIPGNTIINLSDLY